MTQVPETYIEAAEGDLAQAVPVTNEPAHQLPDDLELGIETPEADAVEQSLLAPFDEDDNHR